MSEPAIVSFGRCYLDEYTEEEFLSSLTRAFKENRADFIVLDSNPRAQRFRAACVAWAIDANLLYNDNNADDGQQVVSSFRLTDMGRKRIMEVA